MQGKQQKDERLEQVIQKPTKMASPYSLCLPIMWHLRLCKVGAVIHIVEKVVQGTFVVANSAVSKSIRKTEALVVF